MGTHAGRNSARLAKTRSSMPALLVKIPHQVDLLSK